MKSHLVYSRLPGIDGEDRMMERVKWEIIVCVVVRMNGSVLITCLVPCEPKEIFENSLCAAFVLFIRSHFSRLTILRHSWVTQSGLRAPKAFHRGTHVSSSPGKYRVPPKATRQFSLTESTILLGRRPIQDSGSIPEFAREALSHGIRAAHPKYRHLTRRRRTFVKSLYRLILLGTHLTLASLSHPR